MIPSISQSGITGIQKGLQLANQAASKIASVSNAAGELSTKDLASNLVDLKLAKYQTQASVKVIQVEDKMIGSLLNTKV